MSQWALPPSYHPWKQLMSLLTRLSRAPTVCAWHRSECPGQAVGRRTLHPATWNMHVIQATSMQLCSEERTVPCILLAGTPDPPFSKDKGRVLYQGHVHTGLCRRVSDLRLNFARGSWWAICNSVIHLSLRFLFAPGGAVGRPWILRDAVSEVIMWMLYPRLFSRDLFVWRTKLTALIKANRPSVPGINLTFPGHDFRRHCRFRWLILYLGVLVCVNKQVGSIFFSPSVVC